MANIGLIFFLAAYAVYGAFWCRLGLHFLSWFRATGTHRASPARGAGQCVRLYAASAIDLLFFRRLFTSGKLLWLCSWTFHTSFLFIVIRHLRYLLSPVPACITALQPVGVVAGYALPASLFFLVLLRLLGRKRYVSAFVSYYNFFLLGILFLIGTTGLLMRLFFLPDLVAVKRFVIGIFTFRYNPLPENLPFIIHLGLVLLLLPFLPTHFFSAPLVIVDARKREEQREAIMHGDDNF